MPLLSPVFAPFAVLPEAPDAVDVAVFFELPELPVLLPVDEEVFFLFVCAVVNVFEPADVTANVTGVELILYPEGAFV